MAINFVFQALHTESNNFYKSVLTETQASPAQTDYVLQVQRYDESSGNYVGSGDLDYVGQAKFSIVTDEKGDNTCVLDSLENNAAVDNIGRLLMRNVGQISQFRSANTILPSNVAPLEAEGGARGFYQRFGFRTIDQAPDGTSYIPEGATEAEANIYASILPLEGDTALVSEAAGTSVANVFEVLVSVIVLA